jgi:serine/threonine-protein kinase
VGAPLTKIPFFDTNAHFGRYVIEKELGRGSMGVVYKAYDPVIERPVAIKTLKLDLDRKDLAGFRERFLLEAKSAGRLNHPNIVTIYDVGETDGTAYIAMEYLQGRELRQVLGDASPLTFRQIAEIVQQVAEALAYAHLNGVIHRDIKPANIIIVRGQVPKVLDFGIAQLPAGTVNEEGSVIGSPRYMSPEQITNKAIDGRSDIFSLGTVMYEMLAGRAPFEGETLASIVFQVLHEMPVPPQVYSRNTPHFLARIVARALSKNPAERFQDADEMANELRRYTMKAQAKATIGKKKTSADAAPNLVPVAAGAARSPGALSKTVRIDPPQDVPPTEKLAPRYTSGAYAIGALAALTLVLLVAGLTLGRRNGAERPYTPSPVAGVGLPSAAREVQPLEQTLPAAATASLTAEPTGSPRATAQPSPTAANKPSPPVPAHKGRSRPATPVAAAAESAPPAPARASVQFAIAPWGEIYVDGARAGVSPPLTVMELPLGQHRVEVRNGGAPPYRAEIEVTMSGTKVKHKFE